MFNIPEAVWQLIVSLGRAYGHAWTMFLTLAEGAATLSEFDEAVANKLREEKAVGGITSPCIKYDSDGTFLRHSHTTGSGRLSWDVWATDNGPAVWASISRPNCNGVLEVQPNYGTYRLVAQPNTFGLRHIEALQQFIDVCQPHVPEVGVIEERLNALMPQAIETDRKEFIRTVWNDNLDEIARNSYLHSEIRHEAEELHKVILEAKRRWEQIILDSYPW